MGYTLENLGDERFQQLCQAILTTIHPTVQCLPVGQPDGGRDAIVQHLTLARRRMDSIVFQVKYSKSPSSKDERDSVSELIKTEYDKIKILIENGLQEYYFMTNVSGTSHPGSGSIDKVN